jgi:hypothetical protein
VASTGPNVVDPSAWIDYFANGPNGGCYAPAIDTNGRVAVPSSTSLQVFNLVAQQFDGSVALQYVALMQQSEVVDLDAALALHAAALDRRRGRLLTDSVVDATAQALGAMAWTQESDFDGLAGARYWPKSAP